MTWFILGKPSEGMETDHKDRNNHNNQEENLRFATHSQSRQNSIKPTQRKYRGVSFDARTRRRKRPFYASIRDNGTRLFLGAFSTEVEAALAYNDAAKEIHKEFAILNVVEEPAQK